MADIQKLQQTFAQTIMQVINAFEMQADAEVQLVTVMTVNGQRHIRMMLQQKQRIVPAPASALPLKGN